MKVTFPAMRATIGHRVYYSTTMALSEIPRFFKFNDWEGLDPAHRAQRVLNTSRIPAITRYILENEEEYIFSSITASYKCPIEFRPSELDEAIGVIEMNLEDMDFVINDGQHRVAAITEALKENPDIGKERISVLLFEFENIDRLQQMFTDLNRFATKTSKSLDILYDHRDNLAALTVEVTERVPVFVGMVDRERTSIPLRSTKLITIAGLYDANKELLGKKIDDQGTPGFDEKLDTAVEYWATIAQNIPDWQAAKDGKIPPPQLRQEKINTHTVVLRALGGVGEVLLKEQPDDWEERLTLLQQVDWRKASGSKVNPLWDNVCIVAGSVVSNRQARAATQAVLKYLLDLPLSKQETQIFENLKSAGWKGIQYQSVNSKQSAKAAL